MGVHFLCFLSNLKKWLSALGPLFEQFATIKDLLALYKTRLHQLLEYNDADLV